jgi:hypothetical protein
LPTTKKFAIIDLFPYVNMLFPTRSLLVFGNEEERKLSKVVAINCTSVWGKNKKRPPEVDASEGLDYSSGEPGTAWKTT